MPHVFVLGGPNGAGKSTVARLLLPEFLGIREFVNADEIARGLSAFAPESVAFQAGRILLQRLHVLAERQVSFAFETTLATRSFAPWLRKLQSRGFEVVVLYLWLPDADLAVRRVAHRVRCGGHDVPPAIIRRRYERGLRNFLDLYVPLADAWRLYDNADAVPRLIAHGGGSRSPEIRDPALWSHITRSAP
jgi:predicted ABC-type ATPase